VAEGASGLAATLGRRKPNDDRTQRKPTSVSVGRSGYGTTRVAVNSAVTCSVDRSACGGVSNPFFLLQINSGS
jgi:hypothetical protein